MQNRNINHTHYDKKYGTIYRSIEALDRMGMDIIETCDADALIQYLSEFDNTICGRHPISVFLHMLSNCSTKLQINFIRYEQSSQCKNMPDSSVSYHQQPPTLNPSQISNKMQCLCALLGCHFRPLNAFLWKKCVQ